MFNLMFYTTHAIMTAATCCILYTGLNDIFIPNIRRLIHFIVKLFFTKKSYSTTSIKLTGFMINTLRYIIALLTTHYK